VRAGDKTKYLHGGVFPSIGGSIEGTGANCLGSCANVRAMGPRADTVQLGALHPDEQA
jgi:hypothetical protein